MSDELRAISELLRPDDDAISLIRQWAKEGSKAELIEVDTEIGGKTLVALQVTTHSTLGAVAYHTGGISIDGGWLRILGSPSPQLNRGLIDWNGIEAGSHRLPGAILVADDVVGGFFAINGGAFPGKVGNVFYLAPDTCEWEDLERGYSDWLHWALVGDLDTYYETMRWPGYESEVAELSGDQGVLIYPPLWANEEELEKRARKPVPIRELWQLNAIEFPAQLRAKKDET